MDKIVITEGGDSEETKYYVMEGNNRKFLGTSIYDFNEADNSKCEGHTAY